MYRQRQISTRLASALKAFPVVVVTGMRQTGKSTLLRADPALRDRAYLTLDDFATLETARRDPEPFLERKGPLTIDEVQRAPELFVAIKAAVDRDRRPGRFLLSGSANLALLNRTSESLAGRAVTFELEPFNRRELRGGLADRPVVLELLHGRPPEEIEWTGERLAGEEVLSGGMPEVVLGHPERSLWFSAFVKTYMERDLRDLARVADLPAFRRLLQLCALHTGQLLNETSLALDAHLPLSTARGHLGLLEIGYLLHRVPPFLRNRTARLVKSPKLYLADAGLAAALAGVTDLSHGVDEPMRGALLETHVYANLRGLLGGESPAVELCFWTISGRYEVDFVLAQGRRRMAIEVKEASRWGDRDLRGLRAWQQANPGGLAVLACQTRQPSSLGGGLWALPLGDLLR